MRRLIKAVIIIAFIIIPSVSVAAQEEPTIIRCTCYCYNSGTTAAGTIPKQGLTVAGKKEWIGKACVIYRIDEDGSIGDLIGIYQFLDTGGKYIQSGERIDVYRNTMEECNKWVSEYGDYVYMQVVDAEG